MVGINDACDLLLRETRDFKFGGVSAEKSGEDEFELLEIESETA